MAGLGGVQVFVPPPGWFDPHNWTDPGTTGIPWDAADSGLLTASGEVSQFASTFALTAGTIVLAKMPVRTPILVTSLLLSMTVAGSGGSTGSFAGYYSPTGQLLATSADIAAALTGATGVLTIPMAGGPQVVQPPFIWAAVVTNLATTQPTLTRNGGAVAVALFGNTAATMRYATNATGQTSLPATISLAANVGTANSLLAAAV